MNIGIPLMAATMAMAQVYSTGQSTITLTPGGGWANVTFDNVQKHMQMHKDSVQGNFVLMPIMVEDGAFALTIESKDEMFTQILVEVFYCVQMKQKDGNAVSLLLHKQTTIPSVLKARVMTDPFYIPWTAVKFIRVKGVKEIEQQEFK